MIPHRMARVAKENPGLKETPKFKRELKLQPASEARLTNTQWVRKHAHSYMQTGSLVFAGGSSVTDFRLRVAQSHLRRDLLPSLWSHVALVGGGKRDSWELKEVSLSPPGGFQDVAGQNACQKSRVAAYDNPQLWPNLAVVRFPVGGTQVLDAIEQVRMSRGTIDLSALVIPWLAFVWGAGSSPNPLLQEKGIPSAVFAETVMGIVGIDLTPGISSQASCPEAIWQACKWWHLFYKETSEKKEAPRGVYVVRQPSAYVPD